MSLEPFPEVITLVVRREDDSDRWLAVGMADGKTMFSHRIEGKAAAQAYIAASLQALAFRYMRQAAVSAGIEIPELDIYPDDAERIPPVIDSVWRCKSCQALSLLTKTRCHCGAERQESGP